MKHNTIFATLALLFVGACAQVPAEPETEDVMASKSFEIVAVLDDSSDEDPDTKTTLSGGKVCWETGDKIMIRFTGYTNHYTCTLNPADAGKKEGRFTLDGNTSTSWVNGYAPLYVVYPPEAFSDDAYTIGGVSCIGLNIPQVQTYRRDGFAKGGNICVGAISSMSQTVILRNLGGLVRFTISGSEKVASLSLKSNDDYLCGNHFLLPNAFFTGSSNDCQFKMNVVTDKTNVITLDCSAENGGGVTLSPEGTGFYFWVPAGSLASGFTVDVTSTGGDVVSKTAPALARNEIKRSKVLCMPEFAFDNVVPRVFATTYEPGIYTSPFTTPTLTNSFLSGKRQCATKGNVFRVERWSDGAVSTFTFPSELTVNGVYDIPVVNESGEMYVECTLRMKYLGSSGGLMRFVNEAETRGYVFTSIQ